MKFNDFSKRLSEIEKVSSRLVMTDLLVGLIREVDKSEVEEAVYLMLGELAPKWRKSEFMMADRMVLRSIEMVCPNENNMLAKYKSRGDLGSVAEDVIKQGGGDFTIGEVYERLVKIAAFEGIGSQDIKVEALAKLLKEVGGAGAKYVVRIVLGKLRLGFSDKTVLDALSVMVTGDKEERKRLDNVYQKYPDVGKIVGEVKRGGFAGVDKLKVEVGVPVEPALCQRLNSSGEIIEKMGMVAVERKYDGTRVQIHFERNKGVRTFTRNLDETSEMFPELFNMEKWIKADKLILDCEAVGVDPKTGVMMAFQETIKRKRIHDVTEMALTVPLKFFVFDVLSCDGEDMLSKPYFERREVLARVIRKNEVVIVDDFKKTGEVLELHKYHEAYLAEGFEGAVIKKWNGPYLPGRQGWNWVKIKESEGTTGKLADTLDLVVMGYYRGRGKRASFGIGAFLAGVRNGEEVLTITKVGTGLTDEQFEEMKKRLEVMVVRDKPKEYVVAKNLTPDVWAEPGLVVEIAADELTKSPMHTAGLALRFPRLVRFRDDKDLAGVTSVEELEKIKR